MRLISSPYTGNTIDVDILPTVSHGIIQLTGTDADGKEVDVVEEISEVTTFKDVRVGKYTAYQISRGEGIYDHKLEFEIFAEHTADFIVQTPGCVPHSFSGKRFNVSSYIKAVVFSKVLTNNDQNKEGRDTIAYPSEVYLGGKKMRLTYLEDRTQYEGSVDIEAGDLEVVFKTGWGKETERFKFSARLVNNPIEEPRSFENLIVPDRLFKYLDGYFGIWAGKWVNTNTSNGTFIGKWNDTYFMHRRDIPKKKLPQEGWYHKMIQQHGNTIGTSFYVLGYKHPATETTPEITAEMVPIIVSWDTVVASVQPNPDYRDSVTFYYFDEVNNEMYYCPYEYKPSVYDYELYPLNDGSFYVPKEKEVNVAGFFYPVDKHPYGDTHFDWEIHQFNEEDQEWDMIGNDTVEFETPGHYKVFMNASGEWEGRVESSVNIKFIEDIEGGSDFRYEVFTFNKNVIIGYWVIEDIRAAFKVGVDFRLDPDNIIFRDTFGVKEMIKAFDEDKRVQDSRSGAVYHKDYIWQ